jgi:hypothetical protein
MTRRRMVLLLTGADNSAASLAPGRPDSTMAIAASRRWATTVPHRPSSPPARGLPGGPHASVPGVRVVPACAGVVRRRTSGPPSRPRRLRPRGGSSRNFYGGASWIGSSLPARRLSDPGRGTDEMRWSGPIHSRRRSFPATQVDRRR